MNIRQSHFRPNRQMLFSCLVVVLLLSTTAVQAQVIITPGEGTLTIGSPGVLTGADEFAVGHVTAILHVPGTLGEDRPISVQLWYPARSRDDCDNSDNSDGNRDDQDCSETPSAYTSRLYGVPLLPQWDPLSWIIGSRRSFENMPIARQHRPFPAIIFSHGNQNNAIDYAYTLEALASAGFIVVAPDHVNNTQDDVWIDFVNSEAHFQLLPCFDGLAPPCARLNIPNSMIDRARDISAIIDALPLWFGDRVDLTRVGVMGHSRGTVTALVAAGGSTPWRISADLRVKAIMGLAIGTADITFDADVGAVTVPALLVAGALDTTLPVSQAAFDALASADKEIVVMPNVNHRHFDSGLCAQTQSSGAIASANPRALLDLQTLRGLVTGPVGRVAMDFCGFETFTHPSNIQPLVSSLTGFDFTSTTVPTTGVDSTEVKEEVTGLAVLFFGRVLEGDSNDNR